MATAAAHSALKIAPTANGCVIRVEGRGTMNESTAAKNVALRTLKGDDSASVVFDLSNCEYLDSTFPGASPNCSAVWPCPGTISGRRAVRANMLRLGARADWTR